MHLDLAGDQVARDDATSLAIDDHQVEHLGAREHLHATGGDLQFKCLICAEQELLSRLSAGVKSARGLGAAERAIGEGASILASEWHALSDALIDDVNTNLRESIDVG